MKYLQKNWFSRYAISSTGSLSPPAPRLHIAIERVVSHQQSYRAVFLCNKVKGQGNFCLLTSPPFIKGEGLLERNNQMLITEIIGHRGCEYSSTLYTAAFFLTEDKRKRAKNIAVSGIGGFESHQQRWYFSRVFFYVQIYKKLQSVRTSPSNNNYKKLH